MSFDEIKRIAETERKLKQQTAEASAEAQRWIAAESDARRAEENAALAEAERQAASGLKYAETQAAEDEKRIRADSERRSAELKKAAEKKLNEAADFIVGRIVDF